MGIEKSNRFGALVDQTLPYLLRSCRQHLGIEGAPLPALVALACILQPTFFEREQWAVDVETTGELTRGATIFDRRIGNRAPPNLDVVTECDLQGVADLLSRVARRMGNG